MKSLPITLKQLEILLLLYKFRFLNTHQIQKLLNHKNPQRIQSWLKQLYDNNYLGRIYTKTFSENTKPAIYYLTPKARTILKNQKRCELYVLNLIYREKGRSENFINQCLFIGDLHLFFHSQNDPKDELKFFTRNQLIGYDYFPQPLPDAYMAIKNPKSIKRYFIVLLDEKAPRYALRNRIKKYIEYGDYESSQWAENTNNAPFPSFLVICPNEPIKRNINKFITGEYPSKSFYLTTRDAIKNYDKNNDIWQKVSY
jgi:hypothetical protein